MNMLEIRKAESHDAKIVQSLLKQLGYSVTADDLEKYLGTHQRGDEVYVAIDKGEVVGFMSLIYFDYFPSQRKICRITAILVNENIRGSGVGTELVAFAKNQALRNACGQLEVTTSLLRDKAQKYYESIGFTKSSYRYIQNVDS